MKRTVAVIAVVIASGLLAGCGGSSETKLEKQVHNSAKSFGNALERQKRVTQELNGRGCPKDSGGQWEDKSKAELVREAEELKPGAICHLHQYEETAARLRDSLKASGR